MAYRLSWQGNANFSSIRHTTTYHYNRAVAFGEHRMMLRPRDDDDQKVIATELDITPSPRQLAWTRDDFGNHVATAHFGERARELRFASSIRVDHTPTDFRATNIESFARTYPFAYAPEEWPDLEPFPRPLSPHPRSIDGARRSSVGRLCRHLRPARRHDADHQADPQARRAAQEGSRGCRPGRLSSAAAVAATSPFS